MAWAKARTRGSSRLRPVGPKARFTITRSRVWSGGSIPIIESENGLLPSHAGLVATLMPREENTCGFLKAATTSS